MKRLLPLPLLLFCSPALASLDKAEIKSLGWGSGAKQVALTYEPYCGEGESKEVCNVVFINNSIKVGEDLIPYSQIINFWRNHDIDGTDNVRVHIYIRFLDDGEQRLVKFIMVNKRDAAEFWNFLNYIMYP